MNYNEPSIKKKREELSSPKKRRRTTASAVAFRVILFLICAICVSGAGLAYGSFKGIIASAPKNVSLSPKYSSTIIYDDNNKAVQPLHDYSSNRIKVKSEELPDNLKNAFIAIEDERFYEHDGVDFKWILRALWTDLRNGSTSQGASTLTQQLIKNNVFEAGGESNIIAKIKRKILEQMVYLAMLRGISRKSAVINARHWLERLEVLPYENKLLETLSKGNQQKVQLASTLVCDPEIVILDEPFSGLDPVNSQILQDVVQELIRDGKIVIFSSHQMSYVEEFCEDIVIINHGESVLSGHLDTIKRDFG